MYVDWFRRIPCNERAGMACGHGTCTNFTGESAARLALLSPGMRRTLAPKPLGLGFGWACVCRDGWSGRSDFLDLEGILCSSPVLLEQALWTAAFAVWALNACTVAFAIQRALKFRRVQRDKQALLRKGKDRDKRGKKRGKHGRHGDRDRDRDRDGGARRRFCRAATLFFFQTERACHCLCARL